MPTQPRDRPTASEMVSDRSLLEKLQRGQDSAATQLYVRYANRLRALASAQCSPKLASRVDPEDIVQSVFRTFFRRAVEGHYEVPKGEELWKLFLVIALNKIRATGAYHTAAKRDARATASGEAFTKAVDETAGKDEQALAVLRMVIDEILTKLPESQRQIIELRIEGYEVGEIAAKTGRAKRSVERVLQEFRKSLSAGIHEE